MQRQEAERNLWCSGGCWAARVATVAGRSLPKERGRWLSYCSCPPTRRCCCAGIWTRDMKQRTNLQQPRINKILKVLEERLLVKSVKNVQNASRKVRAREGRGTAGLMAARVCRCRYRACRPWVGASVLYPSSGSCVAVPLRWHHLRCTTIAPRPLARAALHPTRAWLAPDITTLQSHYSVPTINRLSPPLAGVHAV